MISVDFTIFLQLINFLIGLLIINHFIVKPIREVLAKRQLAFDALKTNADDFNAKAKSKLVEHEARIKQVKKEVEQERETLKMAALSKSYELHAEASKKAQDLRKEAQLVRETQSEQAYTDLKAKVNDFAKLSVDRLLS